MKKREYCQVIAFPEDKEGPHEVLIRKTGHLLEKRTAEDASTGIGVLSELGSEGWEAAGFAITQRAQFAYLSKRPIEEKEKARGTAH